MDYRAVNFIHGGCAVTVMRLVNAIPVVRERRRVLTLWDLPLITGGWMNK
jgi:hypothetical protein